MCNNQSLFILQQSVHRFSQLVQQLLMDKRIAHIRQLGNQKFLAVEFITVQGVIRNIAVIPALLVEIFLSPFVAVESNVFLFTHLHDHAVQADEFLFSVACIGFFPNSCSAGVISR